MGPRPDHPLSRPRARSGYGGADWQRRVGVALSRGAAALANYLNDYLAVHGRFHRRGFVTTRKASSHFGSTPPLAHTYMDMYGMPLRTESHTGPHPPRLPRPRERPTTYQPLHPHMQKERIASKWQTTTYHTTTLTTPNKHQEKVTGFSSGVCQSRRVKLLGGGGQRAQPHVPTVTRALVAPRRHMHACARACGWAGGAVVRTG